MLVKIFKITHQLKKIKKLLFLTVSSKVSLIFTPTYGYRCFGREYYTAQKMKFSIKDFFSKSSDLVTFTEKVLNGKLHFLSSVN